MKMFLISDDADILLGMRLAGVKGQQAASEREFMTAFMDAVYDEDMGILLITQGLWHEFEQFINPYRLNERPLIILFPN